MPAGRLVVCATPIGNLGDISDRLRNAFASADVVFAEDTRRTGKLVSHLGIAVPLISLFAGNEKSRTSQVVERVSSGETVVLVSDAGMPTVSDPGADAVQAVLAAGGAVTVVPGPSAVTTALALSGFGGERFVFEGFLPRKGVERTERLEAIAAEARPVVLFVSPQRLPADMEALAQACGPDRQAAVTRELTKLHEEVWVGTLGAAVERWAEPAKGEITLVLGPKGVEAPSIDEALAQARSKVAEGMSVSEAARTVASATGVSRRQIYQSLVEDQGNS